MGNIRADLELAVIVPAFTIPENAWVSKATGEKRYRLKRELIVYGGQMSDKGERPRITPAEGTVFLVDDSASITQYHADTLLRWWTTPAQLWHEVCVTR